MNLDLDPAQRRLADVVRRHASSAPAGTSGWEVLAAAGVTDLVVPDDEGVPLGLVNWCLVAEELGAGRCDLGAVRSVRSWADAAADGPCGPGAVRAAVASWDPAAALPEVAVGPERAGAVADRDLLVCAAYALGLARCCLDLAHERAGERSVGGRPLIEHQGVAHRIARTAFALADARVGVWRAAWWEDRGVAAGHRAPAVAATAVAVALDCAHETAQVFGAAGTSDQRVVGLYRAVYDLPALCGAPGELWRSAGARSLDVAPAGELVHHGR